MLDTVSYRILLKKFVIDFHSNCDCLTGLNQSLNTGFLNEIGTQVLPVVPLHSIITVCSWKGHWRGAVIYTSSTVL